MSLARTLSMNPKVLLLDEPLSALDALTRANLQDEIARLRTVNRQTVALVTNDPDAAIFILARSAGFILLHGPAPWTLSGYFLRFSLSQAEAA